MRRAMHLAMAALLTGLAITVVAAPPAGACSCMGDLLTHADDATAIFAGRITGPYERLDLDVGGGLPGDAEQFTMDVDRVWKGDVLERQAVVVWPAGCGIGSDVDGDLLVFVLDDTAVQDALPGGVYATSLCSSEWISGPAASTNMLGGSVDELGPSHPPDRGASPRAKPAPWWRLSDRDGARVALVVAGATVVGLVAVAIAASLAIRRRRAAR